MSGSLSEWQAGREAEVATDRARAFHRFYLRLRIDDQLHYYQERRTEYATAHRQAVVLRTALLFGAAAAGVVTQSTAGTARAAWAVAGALLAALAAAVTAFETLVGFPQLEKVYGDAARNLEEAKVDWQDVDPDTPGLQLHPGDLATYRLVVGNNGPGVAPIQVDNGGVWSTFVGGVQDAWFSSGEPVPWSNDEREFLTILPDIAGEFGVSPSQAGLSVSVVIGALAIQIAFSADTDWICSARATRRRHGSPSMMPTTAPVDCPDHVPELRARRTTWRRAARRSSKFARFHMLSKARAMSAAAGPRMSTAVSRHGARRFRFTNPDHTSASPMPPVTHTS